MPSYMELALQEHNDPDIERGLRNDPSLSPQGPYGHGEGGLFNIRGASNSIFSAMLEPLGGALEVIPVMRNDPSGGDGGSDMFGGEMAALDTLLTGVTKGHVDEFSNQPTTDCADGPVGGLTKLCTMVNPFGRYRVGVREVSMYRAGQRQDLCDPLTVRLLNTPVMQEFLGVPSRVPSMRNAMSNEIARRMWESAVSFRRMFGERVWIGSPSNNSGERRDIVGLDIHINSGNKVDVTSSALCSAANSNVVDFGYQKTNSSTRNIVEYLEMLEYNTIEWNGTRMGLTPIDGWLFMRPEVWRDISASWPIKQYFDALNNMSAAYASGRVVVNASDAFADRQRFRNSKILPLNGRNYQVVTDETMPFKTNLTASQLIPGQYASDIVFVPRTVMGGIPVTFFQMYNHDNQQAMAIQQLVGGGLTFTTDGGNFRFYVNFKNGCMNMTWEFSPRLKVKTPQIGFRLNNVVSEPLQMVRSADPDSSYFADGGNISTAYPVKYYTPWSTSTPVQL